MASRAQPVVERPASSCFPHGCALIKQNVRRVADPVWNGDRCSRNSSARDLELAIFCETGDNPRTKGKPLLRQPNKNGSSELHISSHPGPWVIMTFGLVLCVVIS